MLKRSETYFSLRNILANVMMSQTGI